MSDNHEPWCDSQLGPDFEVVPGEVRMTIHVCLGCKGEDPPPAEAEEGVFGDLEIHRLLTGRPAEPTHESEPREEPAT